MLSGERYVGTRKSAGVPAYSQDWLPHKGTRKVGKNADLQPRLAAPQADTEVGRNADLQPRLAAPQREEKPRRISALQAGRPAPRGSGWACGAEAPAPQKQAGGNACPTSRKRQGVRSHGE